MTHANRYTHDHEGRQERRHDTTSIAQFVSSSFLAFLLNTKLPHGICTTASYNGSTLLTEHCSRAETIIASALLTNSLHSISHMFPCNKHSIVAEESRDALNFIKSATVKLSSLNVCNSVSNSYNGFLIAHLNHSSHRTLPTHITAQWYVTLMNGYEHTSHWYPPWHNDLVIVSSPPNPNRIPTIHS